MRVKTVYERPRLNRLLNETILRPLTILVAGAGFGKTTTAREWLKKSALPSIWVGLTGGDASVLWDKLCDAIETSDATAANELRTTGVPHGSWEIARIVKIARRRCTTPVIVCIDDFQHLPDDSPILPLVSTLAFEQVDNLHILLLSRREPDLPIGTLASKDLCAVINEAALRFNRDETEGYLAMRGLRLTKSTVSQVYEMSDGWVSAIYLIAEGIREGGSINNHRNIDRLFAENLLAPLAATDREILCRVAPLEPLSAECAIAAIGDNHVGELLDELVSENAFIVKDEQGSYSFHPLLREYLEKRCPDDDFQHNVYRRAGLWYLDQTARYRPFSVKLFEKAGCVDELLERLDHPRTWSLNYFDLDAICALVDRLPDDECLIHPFPFLQIIFFLLLSGDPRNVATARRLLGMMQDHFSTHDHPYRDNILGEIIVISRVSGFGDIPQDSEPLEEAARLLGGHPSTVLRSSDPFTFGLPMLTESEWMGPGELDEAVRRCQYNPYELVTDGFGRGSEQLVRAEAALLRCQMDDACIWAEQADAEAAEIDQWFVMASARFVLMRCALYLGDDDGAVEHLSSIRSLIPDAEHAVRQTRTTMAMLREVVALSECFLNTTLSIKEDIPADFLDGTHASKMVGLGIPEAFSARAMLETGNPSGAERMCRRLDRQPNVCQEARIIRSIVEALARERLYGKGSGMPSMRSALESAQADKVTLPFAEIRNAWSLAKTSATHGTFEADCLSRIREVCERSPRAKMERPSLSTVTLTSREREVLRLAAQGLTRAQIASRICVKEDTVKKHLSSVYRKLGASNRVEALSMARIRNLL